MKNMKTVSKVMAAIKAVQVFQFENQINATFALDH